MKQYSIEIELMFEDMVGDIVEMYSKGHHEEDLFKDACVRAYKENDAENGEEESDNYEFISDATTKWIYGKLVGFFEDGKRIGSTLSYSKEIKKGYFPMTIIYL